MVHAPHRLGYDIQSPEYWSTSTKAFTFLPCSRDMGYSSGYCSAAQRIFSISASEKGTAVFGFEWGALRRMAGLVLTHPRSWQNRKKVFRRSSLFRAESGESVSFQFSRCRARSSAVMTLTSTAPPMSALRPVIRSLYFRADRSEEHTS